MPKKMMRIGSSTESRPASNTPVRAARPQPMAHATMATRLASIVDNSASSRRSTTA